MVMETWTQWKVLCLATRLQHPAFRLPACAWAASYNRFQIWGQRGLSVETQPSPPQNLGWGPWCYWLQQPSENI